jgi:hypothetical protein
MMNHDDEGYTRFRENVQSGKILWEEGWKFGFPRGRSNMWLEWNKWI